jgi:hypothetical protein
MIEDFPFPKEQGTASMACHVVIGRSPPSRINCLSAPALPSNVEQLAWTIPHLRTDDLLQTPHLMTLGAALIERKKGPFQHATQWI